MAIQASEVAGLEPASALLAGAARVFMRQLPLDLLQDTPPLLSNFVPGANQELLAWLQAWPDSAQSGAPTYLWGTPGCGKTHLLQALARHALTLGWQVLMLAPQGFQVMHSNDPHAPTLVLMDDCQALDADQQHWAFNLFIECAATQAADAPAEQGMAIVAAGRLPPVDLPVRDDLRTRLGWGLVFAIEPLDEAGVRDTFLREAQRRGLKLADNVLPYLLTHFSRDLGSLMSLLGRLDLYALAEKRVVTVPLLKQMLALERA